MITEWITEAARETNAAVRRLSANDVDRIVSLIVSRFTGPVSEPHRLWEAFVGEISRRASDGWSELCDFTEAEPILLYQDPDEFRAFVISSTQVLRSVLSETPGFEFYVTNKMVDFVICYNHHDFLIGVGSCAEWLSKVSDEA